MILSVSFRFDPKNVMKKFLAPKQEVILQRFGLSECDGQQPVPTSAIALTSGPATDCTLQGLELCRGRKMLGRCCCPVGYKAWVDLGGHIRRCKDIIDIYY